ncbi:MAG: hypothetical protein AB2724_10975 [Candidatus Thiodiazotropha sp.]
MDGMPEYFAQSHNIPRYIRLMSFVLFTVILCVSCSNDNPTQLIVSNVGKGGNDANFYIPDEWRPPVIHLVSSNRKLDDRGLEVFSLFIHKIPSNEQQIKSQRYGIAMKNISDETRLIESVTAVFYADSITPIKGTEAVYKENGGDRAHVLSPNSGTLVEFSVELKQDIPNQVALRIKRKDEEDSYFIIMDLRSLGGY